ncbi:autotransporter barrel domain-containing lipoprotein [Escherichia coli]|uniref:ECSE_1600 family autotransporter n=1 Tax=Escherichia coli TaxID=562 RepID=UPI0006A012AE|nr:ECSE_1600 family autotransporter [Escherichia coli]EGD7471057.1 autotransporter barrel domain-containing lipoprotein [Escherichia coli]EHX1320864.1 autotransporter barrel domain-containing lipoprotein [Escherichia coli]EJK4660921.1 autotransporter barrel domain-containing lipoprotein [Escherichia coli]CTR24505.1 lipoprotein/autotransporter domain-containing protein [Escherichia coli]CTZ57300.1 lipoprotein/autotransporter domain-containing protein [Escherichia coli]
MNRIYRVIWNCTLQVFQACSELTRRAGKTSTVNLRKSSGLTTKFSRLTLGVLLALSGSASGASLEVDNDQITNIDTDVAYDAYLVGWYGTGVLNILAGGNASLTTITTSVIGANEDSEGTVNVLGGTWRLYDSGNNARPLNVGQSGTGTLNIKQKGHVDGGYLRLGSSTGGVGTVNVEGEDSVLTTELFEIGSYGTGSLNITDKGYVTSSIVAILGYQAGSNGQVVVEKGGEWLIKNNDSSIEFQIGNQGTGEATIREGGLVTAENTIIGGNATGIGTLNVQDQDSVITVRRLYNGYFGNGTVNISNNGLINNKEYSLVGVQDGSHGVVNVTDKGHWNFLGTGEAFRYIYIGDAGDGELNVSSEGKVDSGIITAGMKETGTGNITVKDKNSVITNLGTNLGYDGHGEMNISNQGLVVSNGGSSLGYGETGVGNVSITTGGMWEVNKNVYTTIGVAGVGNLNISDGGKFVSQNITFLGDKASGIGTLNLMDATSSFDTVGINVGNFGSGIVNVSNGATLNSTGYGFIGGNASGKGIVNISTDSLWNLKTSSTNAQLLQVGVLGTGELNITTGGIVKARDTQIALNDKSKGDVRVDGQNSLLETFNMYVGTSGTGTLTLTNNGTLNVEGGEVYLGVFEPAVGTLNIGVAHGEAAADAGFITNATKVEFGLGEGVFVFNHTNNSDAGYQVDMLITGDDKDGKVIHDAGHTVFNAGNTYSGKTLVNDGLLTIASHTADGVTGMGSSEVTIANPGTLDILASTNSAGDYTLTNALKGDGLMRVQLSSSDKIFGFTHATGTEFAGVAQLKDSTFTLERDNTAALTHAMLQSDSENTTSVKVGEQSIGGLAMNGGTIIFDTDIPAATLAEGYISVDTLVVGAGDYTWKGRNYQVNGTGDVLIDVPKPWNDPMANNPLTTLNLLEHDDSHVGVQLVKAQTVIGSGGSLTLRDLQGDEVEADKTLHIAQNGTVVAEGDYGFRLTTAPGNGLYVNYGLKALNIHGGQKLTLAEHGGAYGATADMSAKIGGEGDLAINTVRQVSLSNGQNDYQGATYVQMGTLRTDADGALGNTRELNKMNVKGDTQGNTRVRVDNIGGVGAQTVNGIELIEVGGNSAGNFALTTGTVEAGAYVYTLAKGKGNDEKNWYLTSKWDGVTPADTPDPINNPPVVDPEGPSVYRPEAGSYISNIAAANSLFSHRLHDRLGEPQYTDSLHSQGSASSMWMRHVGGHERSRAGDGQLNTQANRYVLQLGGDLAQWSSNAQDRWHLGVMAGYANQHSNTQSNRVGYKSDGRISGYSAGLYATWYQNDANKTGAYVDSWALYNWFDNSVSSDNRSADDYDSRGVTASVEGGYTFEAGTFSGSEGTLNTWYVQPQAQITWMGVKDSDHTRKDGTRIETEGDGNVQTRLGVKTYLNSHHQRDDGKQREFQPYIEANWINNSKVYAVKMNGQTVGREGARNLGEVRTGVEAKVNNNLSLWGNVGVQLGDKGYSDTQGMLGVKYSW